MDEAYKKEGFKTLKIKASVVKKFRRYSRGISKSQSMTLLVMLEFFEDNGISPIESMGPKMQKLENLIKKRMNGMIAIIKDIEKNQTKPTNAMLELLFQENPEDKEAPEEFFEAQELITENEELSYYRNQYEEVQQQYQTVKYDLEKIIQKTTYVKSSFGSGYLKLNLTKEAFEHIKQKL